MGSTGLEQLLPSVHEGPRSLQAFATVSATISLVTFPLACKILAETLSPSNDPLGRRVSASSIPCLGRLRDRVDVALRFVVCCCQYSFT